MTTATIEHEVNSFAPGRVSFADVAAKLGDIPPDRIIWLPRPATEEDVVRHCESHTPVELVDGFLVEKAMGYRESLLASLVITYLTNYTNPRKLGLVGGPDAIHRLAPGQLRLPDVCYISWDRLLASGAHTAKVSPIAPDLAVEILSESNTRKEIERKRREFFDAGTKLIWVIDPRRRIAEIYSDAQNPNNKIDVGEDGTLDGGAVLPGLVLSLEALFAGLEPPASAPGA